MVDVQTAESVDLVFERFAVHKAFLSGVSGGCAFSAWRFQSSGRVSGLAPRAACVAFVCGGISAGVSWWGANAVRQHAQALHRLQQTSESIHLVPIDRGGAVPISADELDEATGQRAVETNEALLREYRRAERNKN